jgi:hypothetical protein
MKVKPRINPIGAERLNSKQVLHQEEKFIWDMRERVVALLDQPAEAQADRKGLWLGQPGYLVRQVKVRSLKRVHWFCRLTPVGLQFDAHAKADSDAANKTGKVNNPL